MGKSDEETSFCCQYRDSYSGRVAFSQAGSVIVTESAGPSLAQPDTVSGVFRVQEGGAVDLPCLARGQPIPSYTWYKVGALQSTAECYGVLQHCTAEYYPSLQVHPVSGSRVPVSASPSLFPRHSVLSVVGARAADSGRYVCRVQNKVGGR